MRHARVPENMVAAPVSHRAYRTLTAILVHADSDGRCHMKNARLAELTGTDPRHIKDDLKALRDAGIVTVEGRTTARHLTVQLGTETVPSDLGPKQSPVDIQLGTETVPRLGTETVPSTRDQNSPQTLEQPNRTTQEQKERDSPLPLIPAPHDPLATQADKLADAEITRRWGEDGVQIYRQAQSLGVGLAWMLPAVEACCTSKGRYVPTYVAGIVRGYRAEGGPPAPPVAGTVKRKPLDPFEAAKEERAKLILAYREANRK
jgi:hypothetical protein